MQVSGTTLILGGHVVPTTPRAAGRALRAEVRSMPFGLRIWLIILSTFLAIGGVSALLALPPGWEVMGTRPSFEWGLLIVGYVFFAVITSGLCLASSGATVFGIERFRPFEKRHAILAVLSLTTAFGIIALELHYPIRMVFGAVLVISPSSAMWWMGVFYGAYLVVLLVEVWSMFTDHPKIHQWACTAAAGIAVCAPTTLGAVFGMIAAKPFWHGIFTPMLMVASAFLAGTSLLGMVFYAVHRLKLADHERAAPIALPSVRLLMLIALALVSALVIRQVVAGLNSDEAGLRPAVESLLSGPLALQFVGIRVIGGILVPAVLLLVPMTRTPGWTAVASGLALVGVFFDRLTFVTAGQIVPRGTLAGTVSYPYAAYTPSPVEIGIILGALAFLAMGYTLAERYLDMGETDVHVGIPWPWVKRHDAHAHDEAPEIEIEGGARAAAMATTVGVAVPAEVATTVQAAAPAEVEAAAETAAPVEGRTSDAAEALAFAAAEALAEAEALEAAADARSEPLPATLTRPDTEALEP
jgi:molybdopterin-containing oxidoreductase family membrane subunit